jgi:hypothetical protein
MTKEDQRQLLTTFCDQVRDALLARSDQWPENWDGFELRWLVEEAFKFEARNPHDFSQRRKSAFRNQWATTNLY